MSFLHTYKGTLYPLGESYHSTRREVSTLLDIAAAKIVQDASTTKRCLPTLPKELYTSLLSAALCLSKDRTIEILLSHWPSTTLKLSHFVPPLFTSLSTVYDAGYVVSEMKRGMRYTTCLAHTFVECLKRRAPTKLKMLDLTEFPSAEVIVNYVSSHVLLVHNEARQRETINMYNACTRDMPETEKQLYSIDSTIPPDAAYAIRMDAFVQTNEVYLELCRALKTSRNAKCHFKVIVSKLDITCQGVPKIKVILDQLDVTELRGLSVQYNALTNEGMNLVGPSLCAFSQLTAVDLAYNNVNISSGATCDALSASLSSLPHLSRLDLSNNRLRNLLRYVLRDIRPLVYLGLSGCSLSETDVIYLTSSVHATSLKNLDMSDNNLGTCFSEVMRLLCNISSNIQILSLVNTDLLRENIVLMLSNTQQYANIRFLNVSLLHQFSMDLMFDSVSRLAVMPRLQAVKFSYPAEVYVAPPFDESGEIEREMIILKGRLQTAANTLCDETNRSRFKVLFEDPEREYI